MRYFFTLVLLAIGFSSLTAQEQTAKLLQETARTLVQKGDYDNAVVILERAKQQEPNNIEILRDLSYAAFLKRDYAKAVEVGKELVEKPNADEQSFQVLGMAYKAMASYKEAGKLYRIALKKFPNSGVIYNEYGEMFAADNEVEEAITQWEKGIELDPSYSSDYYNATIYHVRKYNWLRAVLYGELFLNLESYSTRSEEVKVQMPIIWKNLLAPGAIQQLKSAKTTSAFEKDMLDVLAKAVPAPKTSYSIDELVAIRKAFLAEWSKEKKKTYPFRLFDHQQYLVSHELFDAYNYWLFSSASNKNPYEDWKTTHTKEATDFTAFQQSRVFKVPAGEYYFSK